MSDQNDAWAGAWNAGAAAGQYDAASGVAPEPACGTQPDATVAPYDAGQNTAAYGVAAGGAPYDAGQLGGAQNATTSYIPDASAPAYAAGYDAPAAGADASAGAWQAQPTVAYGQQDVRYAAQDGAAPYAPEMYAPGTYEASLASQPQYAVPQNMYQVAAPGPVSEQQPVFAPQPAPAPAPQPALAPAPMPAAPKDALPAPTAAPTSVKKPVSPKRRAVIALIAALVVVLIVGGIVFHNLAAKRGDAKIPIQQYLSLLEAGNYGQAAAMADPGLSDDQMILLQDGILPQEYDHVASTRIDKVENTGTDVFTASVSYSLNSESHAGTIVVHRHGNAFNPTWTFDQSLIGAAYVPVIAQSTISISDVVVTNPSAAVYPNTDSVTKGGQTWLPIAAYPGIYTLNVKSSNKYVRVGFMSDSGSGSTDQIVTPANSASEKGVSPFRDVYRLGTTDLVSDLQNMLNEHLDKCVANANAGGAKDTTCYVNADYIHQYYGDDTYYQQTGMEVSEYPDITKSTTNCTSWVGADGSITGKLTDDSRVKVKYNAFDHPQEKDVYAGGSGWTASSKTYDYTVTPDGKITIDYGNVYNVHKPRL